MRTEKRNARMAEIEAAAYALFAVQGFEGTSMLAIAKAAKASNETMYRWYGDKHGLFAQMVKRNAAEVSAALDAARQDEAPPLAVLARIAPVLLGMLLGEKAILLNRAAASDPSGALGKLLADSGRETVLPLIAEVLDDAVAQGALAPPKEDALPPLFIRLLVGDQQVRRVIGSLAEPTPEEVTRQAEVALAHLKRLCAP